MCLVQDIGEKAVGAKVSLAHQTSATGDYTTLHRIVFITPSTFTITCGHKTLDYPVQWNLFIKDTLGPANLSTVERLSTLQR